MRTEALFVGGEQMYTHEQVSVATVAEVLDPPADKVARYNNFLRSLLGDIQQNPKGLLSPAFFTFYSAVLDTYDTAELYSAEQYKKEDSALVALLFLNFGKHESLSVQTPLLDEATVKEYLYSPRYNADRESMREWITQRGTAYNQETDVWMKQQGSNDRHAIFFAAAKVFHLKTYLSDVERSVLTDNLPDYFLLSENDFLLYAASNVDMDLERVEKELSSFDKEVVVDQVAKIRLVRALRFGRMTREVLDSKAYAWQKSLQRNRREIIALMAPVLREGMPGFTKKIDSIGDDKEAMTCFLEELSYTISEGTINTIRGLIL